MTLQNAFMFFFKKKTDSYASGHAADELSAKLFDSIRASEEIKLSEQNGWPNCRSLLVLGSLIIFIQSGTLAGQ